MLIYSVVILFFKQKTAYEMRSSDCSSDVCSSDLPPARSVKDGLFGTGFSHRSRPEDVVPFIDALLRDGGMFMRNGSGALMLAYVAVGRLVGYFEPHINSWDCLAGLLLVREAGGWACDFLADDGLTRGNVCAAAALAVADRKSKRLN